MKIENANAQRIRRLRARKKFIRRKPRNQNKQNEIKNKVENNKISNEIKDLTKMMSNMNLGGGAVKNTNKALIKKEVRNDRIYSAMSLYLRNQTMSLFETNQKIMYFNSYSTYTVATGSDPTHILWFPYFYPCVDPTKMKIQYDDVDVGIDCSSNFIYKYGDQNAKYFVANPINVEGMQRLVCTTMKITNITPNTNKGGAYTVYRLTDNKGTPLIFSSQLAYDEFLDTHDVSNNDEVMLGNHDNCSTKYLFGGNEVGIIDEYNVCEGNTIFGSWTEYLGNELEDWNSGFVLHCSSMGWSKQNPQGINIKYLINIEGMLLTQTYKFETWSLFEVIPPQDSILASTATLQTHIATKKVIDQIKAKFPIHKGN